MRVTPREQEVLQLLSHRYTNKEIAKIMGISTYTVRDHVSSLLHKAGKRYRGELIEPGPTRLLRQIARAAEH